MGGHRSEYLEDSRPGDVEKIWGWMDGPSPETVLWIHGPAGLGKSTLAREIAYRLRLVGRLGAFVSLTALPADARGPESVIKIIARELGEMHPDSIPGITRAIASCKGGPIPEHLIKYLGEPVRSLQLTVGSLLVVLDAFDEWEFHDVLVKGLDCLNSSFSLKFVLFGRSNPWTRGNKVPYIRLHPLEPVPTMVMEKYFSRQFDEVEWDYGHRPPPKYISTLAEQADGLFMWSNIVCSLLKKGLGLASPNKTLESILYSRRRTGETGSLTNLYNDVLSWLFPDAEEQEFLRLYLGTILALQEPLPLDGLASLIKLPSRSIEMIQSRLKALCIRQPADGKPMVYPAKTLFHLSFVEYLQHSATSTTAFAVSLLGAHANLTEACLREMVSFLSTSRDLASLHLSAILQYIIKYWPFHLTHGTPSVEPDSYAEWQKTKIYCILCSIPMVIYRKWGILFAHLVMGRAASAVVSKLGRREILRGKEARWEKPSADKVGMLVKYVGWSIPENDSGLATFAISCLGVATRLRPGDVDAWRILGRAYWDVAHASTSSDLIHQSVRACQNALNVGAKLQSTDRGGLLFSLGSSLFRRFDRLGGFEDRDQSISLFREALEFHRPDHPEYLPLVNCLAVVILARFTNTGLVDDLEEAIRLHRDTDGLTLRVSDNLACCLLSRFERVADVDSLEEAIRLHEGRREFYTKGHPDRHRYLNNFGTCLRARFESTGDIGDVEEAVELLMEALALNPPGHPERFLTLSSLSDALRCRFEARKNIGDLDEATALAREALGLCPLRHRYQFSTTTGLAQCLWTRFRATGDISDLQEAIPLHREVLELRPRGHWTYPSSLYNLANCLSFRFEVLGDIDDLHEAIGLHQESLALRPPGVCERPSSLNNLASCHLLRFLSKDPGDGDDLHRSLRLLRETLLLHPPGHPGRAPALHNLARALRIDGSIVSLEEAVQLQGEALALSSPSHPNHPTFLYALLFSLELLFQRAGSAIGRREAITLYKEYLSLIPPDLPHHPVYHKANHQVKQWYEEISQGLLPGEAVNPNNLSLDVTSHPITQALGPVRQPPYA